MSAHVQRGSEANPVQRPHAELSACFQPERIAQALFTSFTPLSPTITGVEFPEDDEEDEEHARASDARDARA